MGKLEFNISEIHQTSMSIMFANSACFENVQCESLSVTDPAIFSFSEFDTPTMVDKSLNQSKFFDLLSQS